MQSLLIIFIIVVTATRIFNLVGVHARALEGFAKSQYLLKTVVFKSGKRVLTRL